MGFIFSMKREGHEEFSERKWDEGNFFYGKWGKNGNMKTFTKKRRKN